MLPTEQTRNSLQVRKLILLQECIFWYGIKTQVTMSLLKPLWIIGGKLTKLADVAVSVVN